MHKTSCKDLSCSSGQCDDREVEFLIQEKRINLQQRQFDLIQKQKELQQQLQKIYTEQNKLEFLLKDENYEKSDTFSGLEYEIPSYCVNCLGNVYESSSKTALSSEYFRKSSDNTSNQKDFQSQLSDHGRLEAIKFQILLKLGLKTKPNITSFLSKQFIFDTLQRSGEKMINDFTLFSNEMKTKNRSDEIKNENYSDNILDDSVPEEEIEFDEFYGSMREIITFAERGKLHLEDL